MLIDKIKLRKLICDKKYLYHKKHVTEILCWFIGCDLESAINLKGKRKTHRD